MRLRFGLLCTLAAALTASNVWAGGSGYNIVVVANQNSSNSLQLANDYCAQRCVPPQNVLFLNHQWEGGNVSCGISEFQNDLLAPLLNMLQSRRLTNQIEFVLLSMDLPYEVSSSNGLNTTTSCLLYGFQPDTNPPPGTPTSCSLPDSSSNSYAFSELPFAEAPPNTAPTNSFLAFMLTDSNLALAELNLQRGVASDSTFPTQPVYLEKTDDSARNVRFYEFDNAIFDTRIHGGYSMIRTNSDSTSFTNLFGMETGLANFELPTNAFVPGALADSLTSYGGNLFDTRGQTLLLAFLEAGAAGSYGTVIEPCNYLQKFPNPLIYFYQARGFSLAESYFLSVQNPYQGIMVGEPLSTPFALRADAIWEQPSNNLPVLSGSANLQLLFSAAATNLPLNRVDLFVDGTWFETVTNLPPAPGDLLTVTLNGITNTYTVPSNSTVASVASNLASVLNSASNSTLVSATAVGDRIELHSLNPGVSGTNVTLATLVTRAGTPTTFLTAASPGFLDSVATGYHNLLVSNNPVVGDWVQLVVIKTNGDSVTLAATNTTSGETIGGLMQTLFNEINGAAALETSDGVYGDDFDDESYYYSFADFNLYAQSFGWPASAIQVILTASPDLVVVPPGTNLLQDNLSDLQCRNHLYVASGRLSLPVSWTLNTAQLPDGYHELTAIAYEGTSVETQARATENVRIQNSGLSATLNTLYGGSNTDLNVTLQFSVVANTNIVNTTELFGTGGSLGIVTNESTAYFSVAGTNLGGGLHPFYALVTAGANQYRTATTWIRLIGTEPPLSISVSYPPLTLSWSSTAGRAYNILEATNVAGPYRTNATVTPSNSVAVWIDTNTSTMAKFYSVQTSY